MGRRKRNCGSWKRLPPACFEGDQGGWKLTSSIDDPSKAHKAEAKESTALNMFRQLDLKGTTDVSANTTSLATIHQNTITRLRPYEVSGGRVTRISSTGNDGKIVFYKV